MSMNIIIKVCVRGIICVKDNIIINVKVMFAINIAFIVKVYVFHVSVCVDNATNKSSNDNNDDFESADCDSASLNKF